MNAIDFHNDYFNLNSLIQEEKEMVYSTKSDFIRKYTEKLEEIRNDLYDDLKDIDSSDSFTKDYFESTKLDYHTKITGLANQINEVLKYIDIAFR